MSNRMSQHTGSASYQRRLCSTCCSTGPKDDGLVGWAMQWFVTRCHIAYMLIAQSTTPTSSGWALLRSRLLQDASRYSVPSHCNTRWTWSATVNQCSGSAQTCVRGSEADEFSGLLGHGQSEHSTCNVQRSISISEKELPYVSNYNREDSRHVCITFGKHKAKGGGIIHWSAPTAQRQNHQKQRESLCARHH